MAEQPPTTSLRDLALPADGERGAVLAHALGDRVEAFRRFERNRAAAGSPGLFAEVFDVQQRQLRGNLPQAFVHALMPETSVTLGT